MSKFFLLILLLSTQIIYAQPPDKFLIRTGQLFDSESGEFKSGLCILVNGNLIEAVKPAKEITDVEAGSYKLIDLSKYTVLPGLIDCHTHLLAREVIYPNNSMVSLDMVKSVTMEGDAYRAIYGSARAKGYLEAGITSVQDLGNSGLFADIALRKCIARGIVPGPRMRCAGRGLAAEGGQFTGVIYKYRDIANDEYRIVKGVDDAVQAVRENIAQGATVIKIFSDNSPNRTLLSAEEIQAIVKEAHRYNVRVTAHAVGNESVYYAAINGVDAIEHGYSIADSTLELMARKGIVLVPTDADSLSAYIYNKLENPTGPVDVDGIKESRKKRTDRLKRAIAKGVPIASGSDDYIYDKLTYGEGSKRTLIAYNESGVPLNKILQFATINAGKHLNYKNLGVIKQGFYADIIAVDNSINKNIYAILDVLFVMKDGTVYVNKVQQSVPMK